MRVMRWFPLAVRTAELGRGRFGVIARSVESELPKAIFVQPAFDAPLASCNVFLDTRCTHSKSSVRWRVMVR